MLKKFASIIKKINGNKPWGLYSFSIWSYTKIRNFLNFFRGFHRFLHTRNTFKKLAKKHNIKIDGYFPFFLDCFENAGNLDIHYFLQDIYMAQKILEKRTKEHYDIGSRIDGFIAHLLSSPDIEKVTLLDVRPLSLHISKLGFIQTDATNLAEIEDNTLNSISSLHALEHFGLGRYGDPIDPVACYKAMQSIQRVVKKDGYIYISGPISNNTEIWFNGMRKFSPLDIINNFDKCDLLEFSVINNYKIKTYNADETIVGLKNNSLPITCIDCGMFIFKKR